MSADELPESNDNGGKPKKRSWLKVFIILFFLLVFFCVIAGASWWFFLRSDATFKHLLEGGDNSTKSQEKSDNANKQEDKKGDSSSGLKPVLKPVSLPSVTVNLADPSGNKYLRMGMDVELSSEGAITNLLTQSARVRDAIILLLSSKTSDELASAEGKVLLKNEVASRLNQILGEPRVVRIYFTDFVIQ